MKMSLCHIWFGVLRSKSRGLAGFFFGLGFLDVISSVRCRVLRTVSGLAGRWKIRRKVCAMRLTPKAGWLRFSLAISARIAVRELAAAGGLVLTVRYP
jgi:hypothetical protein